MMGLVFFLAVAVYVYLAKLAVQHVGRFTERRIAKHLMIAVFMLVPTWDIIPGQIYHRYLCDNEAGITVLRVIEIDRSYFKADGKPDEKKLADRYSQSIKFNRDYSAVFRIEKVESMLEDKRSGEVLGRTANFSYGGGWLGRFMFAGGERELCSAHQHFREFSAIWEAVIKPLSGPASEGGK